MSTLAILGRLLSSAILALATYFVIFLVSLVTYQGLFHLFRQELNALPDAVLALTIVAVLGSVSALAALALTVVMLLAGGARSRRGWGLVVRLLWAIVGLLLAFALDLGLAATCWATGARKKDFDVVEMVLLLGVAPLLATAGAAAASWLVGGRRQVPSGPAHAVTQGSPEAS